MGEARKDTLRFEFHGTGVTSDAGLVLDEDCGIIDRIVCRSTDYEVKRQAPAQSYCRHDERQLVWAKTDQTMETMR